MLEASECCLCAQIEGRAANDLIAGLLSGRPYVRRVMYESAAFALVPSLGPLTPGHSLLCPKMHVRSFAELPARLNEDFAHLMADLKRRLAALYDADVHVFEHGVARGGTRTLCTVDHAHMHLVPLPRGLGDLSPDGAWSPCDGSLTGLRARARGREYVYYETPTGAGRMRIADTEIESQFMRKVIARRLERPERWDWRADAEAAAADEAWRRFAGR
jgi:diadenosine tetraphosphate (Ap4A) HIT family hydrolase